MNLGQSCGHHHSVLSMQSLYHNDLTLVVHKQMGGVVVSTLVLRSEYSEFNPWFGQIFSMSN